jgi:cytochrome c oxidase subunit I
MATATAQGGQYRRPTATTGWWGWVTTVDHKKIGIMYCATALLFFVIGGLEALAIRMQLAVPNGTTLTAETYNQFFTMHGLTMIFLVVMPLGVGIMNYLAPLMIGARDVASLASTRSATGSFWPVDSFCTRAFFSAARRMAAGSAAPP